MKKILFSFLTLSILFASFGMAVANTGPGCYANEYNDCFDNMMTTCESACVGAPGDANYDNCMNACYSDPYAVCDGLTSECDAPAIAGMVSDPEFPECSSEVEVCVDVTDISPFTVSLTCVSPSITISQDMSYDVAKDMYCSDPDFSGGTMGGYDGVDVTCTVEATDVNGNVDSDTVDPLWIYDCADPVADANGPYTCDEGTLEELDASASWDNADPSLDYAWDLDNDGVFDDAFAEKPMFACNDDSVTTVSVKVTDNIGRTDTASSTVTVSNLNPEAYVSSDSCNEGETITLDASGSTDPAGSYDPLTFAWDLDGSGYVAGSATASYTCKDGDAAEKVCVEVNDGDSGVDSFCTNLKVSNVDPAVDAGGPYTCDEGTSVTLTASATDPAGALDPLTYVWTINGSVYNGQAVIYDCLDGDNVIAAEVTVTDGDGGSDSDSTDVNVDNVDPWNVDAGEDVNAVVFSEDVCFNGSAMDVAADIPLTFDWDFGDNDSDSGESVCHSYDARGAYTVTLTVSDKDSGSSTDTLTVAVYDYKIELDEGWNLISVPLVPEADDARIETVFGSIADYVERIWAYTWDESQGKNIWTKHRVTSGVFDSGAELQNVIPGYGYYVKMAEDTTLYLNGKISYLIGDETGETIPVMGMPPSVTLATNSWNLIGKYGFSDAPMYFDLVSLDVAGVSPWDSAYYDIAYDKNGVHPYWFEPTSGYWLSVKLVPEADTIEYKANYDEYDGPGCGYCSGMGPGCYND